MSLPWSAVLPKVTFIVRKSEGSNFDRGYVLYIPLYYPSCGTRHRFFLLQTCDTCSNEGFCCGTPGRGTSLEFLSQPFNWNNVPKQHDSSEREFFLVRCWWQYRISGFLIADWFDVRRDFMEAVNPYKLHVAPYDFEHVHIFVREWSYVLDPQPDETKWAKKKRVYVILRGMKQAAREPPRMRIMMKTPSPDCLMVWENTSINQRFLQGWQAIPCSS